MGVGVAVIRPLCPREGGIQQEWCWAEKFWSFVGARKGRRSLEVSCAGLGVMRVSLICPQMELLALSLLLWLFHCRMCWIQISEDTLAAQDTSGLDLSCLPCVDIQCFLPMWFLLFCCCFSSFGWLVGSVFVSCLLFNLLFPPLTTLLLLQPCPRQTNLCKQHSWTKLFTAIMCGTEMWSWLMLWSLIKKDAGQQVTCYCCRFFRPNLMWGVLSWLGKMTAAELPVHFSHSTRLILQCLKSCALALSWDFYDVTVQTELFRVENSVK